MKANKRNLNGDAATPAKQDNQLVHESDEHETNSVLSQTWSGPLPPPAALENFSRIIPDGANRIMIMVEQEQKHRIDHENKALNAAISDAKLGKWIGGSIAVLSIFGAIYTAYIGAHPLVSCALVGMPIMTVIKSIINSVLKKD